METSGTVYSIGSQLGSFQILLQTNKVYINPFSLSATKDPRPSHFFVKAFADTPRGCLILVWD